MKWLSLCLHVSIHPPLDLGWIKDIPKVMTNKFDFIKTLKITPFFYFQVRSNFDRKCILLDFKVLYCAILVLSSWSHCKSVQVMRKSLQVSINHIWVSLNHVHASKNECAAEAVKTYWSSSYWISRFYIQSWKKI